MERAGEVEALSTNVDGEGRGWWTRGAWIGSWSGDADGCGGGGGSLDLGMALWLGGVVNHRGPISALSDEIEGRIGAAGRE